MKKKNSKNILFPVFTGITAKNSPQEGTQTPELCRGSQVAGAKNQSCWKSLKSPWLELGGSIQYRQLQQNRCRCTQDQLPQGPSTGCPGGVAPRDTLLTPQGACGGEAPAERMPVAPERSRDGQKDSSLPEYRPGDEGAQARSSCSIPPHLGVFLQSKAFS